MGRRGKYARTLALVAVAVGALPATAAATPPVESLARLAKPARALAQAQIALDPQTTTSPATSREITLALRDLALAMPELGPAERRAAKRILARPTDRFDPGGTTYRTVEAPPHCTVHFCVHYVPTTDDAPSLTDAAPVNGIPDYVETVAAAAEHSHAVENGVLGWPAPKSDGALGGGSGLTDIYLANIGRRGIFGYTAPDPAPAQYCRVRCHAYLVLDDDYSPAEFGYPDPGIPLRVTIAHEYNHVLQFAISAVQDPWLFESSAVWIEEQVFPDDNDYLEYVRAFAATPGVPITKTKGARGLRIYGTAVLHHWLDSGVGNFGPGVVRDSWLASTLARPKHNGVASIDKAIRGHGGDGFAREFSKFAAATAEWRTAGGFPDAAAYPDVKRRGTLRRPRRPLRFTLDHTAYRLIEVKRRSGSRVKLRVRAEPGVRTGVALVALDREAATVRRKVKVLSRGGGGSTSLSHPRRYERITAAVVNADGRVHGFGKRDWNYTRDGARFRVALVR